MRSARLLTVVAVAIWGCSSAPPPAEGGGGEGGAGGGGQAGAPSTGGAAPCEVIHLGKFREWANSYYEADIVENIDGPEKDVLSISFWYSPTQSTWTGVQDLGSDLNDNFETCTTCVNIYADDSADHTNVYFQSAGTLDIGDALIDFDSFDDVLIADGSIANARFVEVTLDIPTRISTPVPGGKCFEIVMGELAMTPPPAGWTCGVRLYDDDDDCDCGCGVVDEDCSDPAWPIEGCLEGQTCDAGSATCTGVPTVWTCDPAEYDGGDANGCDCGCGAHDPDCDLVPTPALEQCAAGETCNAFDTCVPVAWTCEPDLYDDGDSCDCGCGAQDADCLSANKIACDTCDATGSCDTLPCADAGSTINSTNNGVCN